MKKNTKKGMKVPFYAHLLSRQEMINAGGNAASLQTKKYPSDQEDTDPLQDQDQTMKYPSDNEDTNPMTDNPDI